MVNNIIDGISLRLDEVFGETCRISSEKVDQGLKEPYFLIFVISPSRKPIIGQRHSAKNNFDIHYFPKEHDNRAEMTNIGEALYDALEYIKLLNGDLVKATNMRYEIIDGVLHFFINYNMTLIKKQEKDYMEELLPPDINLKG